MKKTAFVFVFVFVFVQPAPAQNVSGDTPPAQETQRQRLEQHLYTLAADSLGGRQAGTDDAARARAYITRQWREMGLKPLWEDSYDMPFEVYKQQGYCNLVAIIPGNDSALKNQYIVVGGHYDHLGVKNGQVYNGADDNASGTACVTELARQLLAHQNQLKRSVIICAFDAEEMGLYGSQALANQLESQGLINQVQLMLSIDMVGWYKQSGHLSLQGTGTLADPDLLTDAKSLGTDINIHHKNFENSIFTATDTEPFAKKGIPTLAVTTGLKSPYHKPEDDPQLIDYQGLDQVTDYLAAFVIRASQHPATLASGKVAPKHRQNKNKFEAAITLGTNTGYVTLTDAAVTPNTLPGWTAGLTMQYNFNNTWALHASLLYSHTRTRMPLPDDAFGPGYRLKQQSLTLPLTLQAGVYSPGLSLHLRAGAYFNYLILGTMYTTQTDPNADIPSFQAPSPYRGGLTWGWGFRIGSITFDMDSYYQLGPIFNTQDGLPNATGGNLTVSLGYYF